MALPSTFQERLHHMEETRNQRLSLLQAEKELQIKKTQLLNEKLSNMRSMEQRCLLLEKRNAEIGFQILAKKSEIDALDARYQASAREFRDLKSELDELEGREKERDRFYEMKRLEMEEFKEQVSRRVTDVRLEVEYKRSSVSEVIRMSQRGELSGSVQPTMKLRSTLNDLQGNDGYLDNAEIAAAETRKAKLLAIKEDLDKSLASNYQLRSLLQKQLQKVLVSQDQTSER